MNQTDQSYSYEATAFYEPILLIEILLTIQEHFLEHHTFQFVRCKLAEMGILMVSYQHHSDIRRTFGNQTRVGILDVQQLDPYHH